MDSDSSQMLAIHESAERPQPRHSGPPGTGKSQTIANVIAARDRRRQDSAGSSQKKWRLSTWSSADSINPAPEMRAWSFTSNKPTNDYCSTNCDGRGNSVLRGAILQIA